LIEWFIQAADLRHELPALFHFLIPHRHPPPAPRRARPRHRHRSPARRYRALSRVHAPTRHGP
jgi:hypothetical protein